MGVHVINAVRNVGTSSVKALAENLERQVLVIANKDAANSVKVKFGSAHNTADVTGVQTVSFGATPSVGALVLSWLGVASTSIDHSADAAAVQTSLRTIAGLGSVTVSGSFAAGFAVTMTGVGPVDPTTLLAVSANTLGTTATVAATTPQAYIDGVPLAAGALITMTGDACPVGDVYLVASGSGTRVELVYG